MHKRLEFNLFAQRFPRDIAEDYELDEEESATHPPLNFGEAVIVLLVPVVTQTRSADFSRPCTKA